MLNKYLLSFLIALGNPHKSTVAIFSIILLFMIEALISFLDFSLILKLMLYKVLHTRPHIIYIIYILWELDYSLKEISETRCGVIFKFIISA